MNKKEIIKEKLRTKVWIICFPELTPLYYSRDKKLAEIIKDHANRQVESCYLVYGNRFLAKQELTYKGIMKDKQWPRDFKEWIKEHYNEE